jgi:hypothetical protein
MVLAAELVMVFKEHEAGFDDVKVGESIKRCVKWIRESSSFVR